MRVVSVPVDGHYLGSGPGNRDKSKMDTAPELPRWSPTPVLNGPHELNFAIRNGMRWTIEGMAVSDICCKLSVHMHRQRIRSPAERSGYVVTFL